MNEILFVFFRKWDFHSPAPETITSFKHVLAHSGSTVKRCRSQIIGPITAILCGLQPENFCSVLLARSLIWHFVENCTGACGVCNLLHRNHAARARRRSLK